MGKRRRKKAKQNVEESEAVTKAPHSFIFHRGKVGIYVHNLIRNIRRVMEPYTALRLKVLKKNVLKDFASVAGVLGVTHMIVFTRTAIALNMRLIRLPRGPTLTFRVHDYSLNRDVISSLKKAQTSQQYFHHPLLVMNNFHSDQRHLKLTESAFQNMFPSINVNTMKLRDIKRCLLLDYNTEEDRIYFRHYSIKTAPSGISSSTRKLMKKKLPDMGKYADISDYFLRPAHSSDSEYEGAPGENEIEMPNTDEKSAVSSSKIGIKLTEIGPRLTLQLIKIQDGFSNGEVLYHKFVKKTPAERQALRKAVMSKEKLKAKRRAQQEENVKRKKALAEKDTPAKKKVKFKVSTASALN